MTMGSGKETLTGMISFESDYIAGAHPALMKRLIETNSEPLSGYGTDRYSGDARQKIRDAVGMPDAVVEFIAGGTQTNAVVISSLLRDWEGVIAAETGHIAVHEAGAIEYSGHKVLTLPQKEGKIDPETLKRFLSAFFEDGNREHTVYPGMVYISFPTEYGTLYTKKELTALSEICRAYGLILYLDGARLGFGLASPEADMTLADIMRLCDVFSIGGTKIGALCGEAVVFKKDRAPRHFMNSMKKRGALLAKGRLTGVQFDALFTDGLYFEISRQVIGRAMKLKELFRKRNVPLLIDSPTNQQFVILEDAVLARLKERVSFCFWEKYDESHTVVRFAVGWSTTDEDLRALEDALDAITD